MACENKATKSPSGPIGEWGPFPPPTFSSEQLVVSFVFCYGVNVQANSQWCEYDGEPLDTITLEQALNAANSQFGRPRLSRRGSSKATKLYFYDLLIRYGQVFLRPALVYSAVKGENWPLMPGMEVSSYMHEDVNWLVIGLCHHRGRRDKETNLWRPRGPLQVLLVDQERHNISPTELSLYANDCAKALATFDEANVSTAGKLDPVKLGTCALLKKCTKIGVTELLDNCEFVYKMQEQPGRWAGKIMEFIARRYQDQKGGPHNWETSMANQGAVFHAARQQPHGSNFGMVGGGTLTPAQQAAVQKRRSMRINAKKSKSNNVPPSGKQGKKGQKAKGRKSAKKGKRGKKGKVKVKGADARGKSVARGKSALVQCPWCARSFKQRGIKMHRNHCKNRPVGTPLRRPQSIASPPSTGGKDHTGQLPKRTPARHSLGDTLASYPSPRTMRLDKLSQLLRDEKESTLRKLQEAKQAFDDEFSRVKRQWVAQEEKSGAVLRRVVDLESIEARLAQSPKGKELQLGLQTQAEKLKIVENQIAQNTAQRIKSEEEWTTMQKTLNEARSQVAEQQKALDSVHGQQLVAQKEKEEQELLRLARKKSETLRRRKKAKKRKRKDKKKRKKKKRASKRRNILSMMSQQGGGGQAGSSVPLMFSLMQPSDSSDDSSSSESSSSGSA